VLDFREYAVVRDGDEIVVVGTIREPVVWDFSIRICEDDLPGVAQLATQRETLGLLLRALFRRHGRHHWSQAREAHIAEGRRRREAARAEAEERLARSRAPVAGRRPRPPRRLGRSALGRS